MGHSSLHWDISISVCSFSYNGVYYDQVKLSVSEIIVSQKGSNGDRKLLLCEKCHFLKRQIKKEERGVKKIFFKIEFVRFDGTKC